MMKIADIQAGNQVILDACNTEQGRNKLASKLEDYANQIMGFGLDRLCNRQFYPWPHSWS